jgi:hypothetical protein
MAGRLTGWTAVRDDDGVTHSFGPDSDVPEWAAKRITNPKLWEGDRDDDSDDSDDPGTAGGSDPADDGAGSGQGSTDGGDGGQNLPEPPPKGGKGSGLEEWLIYASYFPQVSLPEDASREDVIDALDAEGIRTE